MKTLRRVLLGIGILVVIALVVLWLSLDGLVRAGTEKALTTALETESKVGGASISLFGGKFGLSEISVANPEGFEETTAFAVGDIGLDADLISFLGDEGHIREISIRGPQVVIEQKGGTTNLGELLDRLGKKGKAPEEKEPAPPQERKEEEKGEGKKFRVDRVFLGDTRVRLRSDYLPGGPRDLRIPDIEITDIGGEENRPVQVARIVHQILQSILEGAVETGVELPKELRAVMNSDLEGLKAKVEDRLRQELDRAGEKGRKALEGLLPGGEDR
jgi:hypothetical protein